MLILRLKEMSIKDRLRDQSRRNSSMRLYLEGI